MEAEQGATRLPQVRSKRHRRWHSHKLLATLIVLVVIAALGGGTDLAYVSLKSQADQLQSTLTNYLQVGQHELEAGKEALKQANAKHDTSLVAVATAHFASAKNNFLTASRVANDSKLLRYLQDAPSVGDFARSRHTALDAVAEMGVAISDSGRHLSDLDGELLKPPAGGDVGRTMLTVLDQTHTGLAVVRNDLDRARKAASRVSVQVLPVGQQATFVHARESIASGLAGLDEFERLVPILTEVLGGNGPRRYLIEQVNPAELRAGGGFVGTFSLIQADHGKLQVLRSGNAYELADPRPLPWQAGFIPQPTPYREIIPQISWSFVDSNVYPDFPSNARVAEQFVQPRLGRIDGVIAMDYYTVAKLLELTGPIDVPGWGIRVDANNFISEAIHRDITDFGAHKLIFSSLSGPLMDRVSSLPSDQWPTFVSALNGLASARHLQAYFNSEAVEQEMDRIGWSGGLNPLGHSDFMMEVESNYYGNKANYWMNRHYSIALKRVGNTLHHLIAVDIVNNEPCGAEVRTLYKGNTRLYVGLDATSLAHNLTGVRYANPPPPPNTQLLDGWLFVPCGGGHSQGAFEFDTQWPEHGNAPHWIYWQKQPGTASDALDLTWDSGAGDTYKVHGELGQDLRIKLSPNGVAIDPGHPAQATLPSLALG
jgi:hypothetical protein